MNRGTREDFAKLAELGVDCRGCIALARYGGNYRGYKAKYAEAAGAVGLVIFTDPRDSGYGRGAMYPDGGYANPTSIERGSIKTLDWFGDPLTPDREATRDAVRLEPAEVDLPRIPVQPVGWIAAQPILARLGGPEAPGDWQGGLPLRYRIGGGCGDGAVTVRLAVEQRQGVRRTANVLATLRGREQPEHCVILGSHHDAWGCGAGDPTSGLITVLEAARVFAAAARDGWTPRRSVTFAAWGAEEFGIVGSVEFVESRLEQLRANAVAYVNLDMAAMGPDFRAAADPSLQTVIADASTLVPQAGDPDTAVRAHWEGHGASDGHGGPVLPPFGTLGGGSDHVGFVFLAGVPSAAMGAGGARGTSYHSSYDDLHWYRQVVGDDYASAVMVTRIVAATAAQLADRDVLPIDPSRTGPETLRHLAVVQRLAVDAGLAPEPAAEGELGDPFAAVARAAELDAGLAREVLGELERQRSAGVFDEFTRRAANSCLMALDRCWLDDAGLPGRPWFRNLFAATDEDSGYAAWMLPGVRAAIAHGDATRLDAELERCRGVFARRRDLLAELWLTLRR